MIIRYYYNGEYHDERAKAIYNNGDTTTIIYKDGTEKIYNRNDLEAFYIEFEEDEI